MKNIYIHRALEFISPIRRIILGGIDTFLLILTFIGVLSMIYKFGFKITAAIYVGLQTYYTFLLYLIFFAFIIRIILDEIRHVKKAIIRTEYAIFIVLLSIICSRMFYVFIPHQIVPFVKILNASFILYTIIVIVFLIELSKKSLILFSGKINPALLFISSFLFIILVGAGLLLLPNSTTAGISFIDALFTSTSAVCVTGLTTVDTAFTFTTMGKTIILSLIQVGGIGVITFTSFFGLFFMGGGSFRSNLYIKDFVSSESAASILKTLLKIILSTIIIELIGVLFIFFNTPAHLFSSIADRLGFAFFHGISAFCNAGFSTLSAGLYDINFRFNYPVHLTIAFLIILGGIGFPLIINYYNLLKHFVKNKFNQLFRGQYKYHHVPRIININTKIVLITTFCLLAFGTVTFFIFEYHNTLREHPSLLGKLVVSFFGSVTPRTAGFNVVNMTELLPATLLITMFLMWVGASPASTGGGIKTSSFAIALMNTINIARGKDRIDIYKRQISDNTISKAFSMILLSILVIGVGVILISFLEPGKDILKIAFECVSAFGTVGLSIDFTPHLSTQSKYVLIVLMFLGRVGTLTLIVAFIRKVVTLNYKYPEEEVLIG